MTTSISGAQAETLARKTETQTGETASGSSAHRRRERTLADRFIFLTVCVAIVMTTLAYGAVYYWSLAIFAMFGALIILLWAVDGWQSRVLRLSGNALQWPLIGLFIVGLVQLLPFGNAESASALLSSTPVRSISFDPYSTRLVLVQIASLFVYFAATLVFTDSPRRLRTLVRTITIFGFLLAIFGLTQSFVSPTRVYGLKELQQSTAFGPFINRHHFAGYMELALALPLGLLFSGAIEKDKRLLYIFAVALMAVALVMTQSRGGIISLVAELVFLAVLTGFGRAGNVAEHGREKVSRVRRGLMRAGLALALIVALFFGVLMLGGEDALTRFVGTVNTDDPTTGRAHFWSVALQIIHEHPLLGAGLGAFGVIYTRFDTRNGIFRLEQAHNDYLQVLADAGIVGALLGVFFIFALFRMGFARRRSEDPFRRGVATGALAGCLAVLVHSFFDFTLHTTSNALLFLVLAALATLNGRVEQQGNSHRRRRRRRSQSHSSSTLPSTHTVHIGAGRGESREPSRTPQE
ncbi:MAG: O-antigen ligase family protein [Pyrinomonadaceae bacterium]